MRYAVLALVLSLSSVSCVATTADLTSLQERLIARLSDGDEAAIDVLRDEFDETVDDIERRVESGLETGAGLGGGIGVASALLLNLYRNKTRKKDLEIVEEKVTH